MDMYVWAIQLVNPWHWLSLNSSFCIQPSVIKMKHLILSVSFTKEAYLLQQAQ